MEESTKLRKKTQLKIVGIVGSPHKDGMTNQLVRQALAGAEQAGAKTTLFYLVNEKMEPCQGCDANCWETQKCIFDPSSAERNARLQNADGLVIGAPVYCWQVNSLTTLFFDKMRWDTGSVIQPQNQRAAFGIACAGGSGTGCIMGLQALYRYFYNWAFHGIQPLPVTRFNYHQALEKAYEGGQALVETIQNGLQPFCNYGEAILDLESLPYMKDGPLDELRLIVKQLQDGLQENTGTLERTLYNEAKLSEEAWMRSEWRLAAEHLSKAYNAGNQAWDWHTKLE